MPLEIGNKINIESLGWLLLLADILFLIYAGISMTVSLPVVRK